ncbi:MAG TPA: S26 family signal peptidase [Sedimentisphaerales bacterium]|nr:S26 family signal peptidase [Sedimentisphaerales bacterium]
MLRWMRQAKFIPQQNIRFHAPAWMKQAFSDSVLGLFLSVIPGLAHLVQGRFKEIRWYFLAWLMLLFAGLFFYPGAVGFAMLGVAIGVHVGIALQYGLFKELPRLVERVAAAAIGMAVLALIYRFLLGLLFSGLVAAYTPLAIPYYGISAGDYLLARRYSLSPEQLTRGSVVLIHPVTIIAGFAENRIRRDSRVTVGEIIGLPCELVEIEKGTFAVSGERLDPEMYPVPTWLQNRQISVSVNSDCYFVSSEYAVRADGRQLADVNIRNACIIRASDIEGRAFMIWYPLWRRGFLR